jgi:hypothetical protein
VISTNARDTPAATALAGLLTPASALFTVHPPSPGHGVAGRSLVTSHSSSHEATAYQADDANGRDGPPGRPARPAVAPYQIHRGVGRGCGVGRGLGVALGVALGVGLTVGVTVGVPDGVGVAVGVALGVGVGVGP